MYTLLKQFRNDPAFVLIWLGLVFSFVALMVGVPKLALWVYGLWVLLALLLTYFQRHSKTTRAITTSLTVISVPMAYTYFPMIGWFGIVVWIGLIIWVGYLFFSSKPTKN